MTLPSVPSTRERVSKTLRSVPSVSTPQKGVSSAILGVSDTPMGVSKTLPGVSGTILGTRRTDRSRASGDRWSESPHELESFLSSYTSILGDVRL